MNMHLSGKFFIFTVCLFFLLLESNIPVSGAASSSQLAQWKKIKMRESMYSELPKLVFGENDGKTNKINLVFTTRISAPAASVHIGVVLPGEKIGIPVFRNTFREKLTEGRNITKTHSISVLMDKMSDYIDLKVLKSSGCDICYRVEVWNPEELGVSFFESRCRIKEESGIYRPMPTIREGPFVDMTTSDSAVLSWKTDVPTKMELMAGERRIKDEKPGKEHIVKVSGLKPDTVYKYKIRIYDEKDSYLVDGYSFKTAPLPGKPKKFRFAYMSDSRSSEGGGEEDFLGFSKPDLEKLFLEAYRKKAEFIIFGGDQVDGFCSEPVDLKKQLHQWKLAIEPFGHYIPVYEVIGNHEFTGDAYLIPEENHMVYYCDGEGIRSMEHVFASEFVNPSDSFPEREELNGKKGPSYEETVYSFDYSNCHFVVLNSDYWLTGVNKGYDYRMFAEALNNLGGNRPGYLMNNQLKWLEKDLKSARRRKAENIFIVLHEPPFPNGGHANSAMFWGSYDKNGVIQGLNDKSQPLGDVLDMRKRFLKLVSDYKVIALLTAHEHNYSRLLMNSSIEPVIINSCWQILSGDVGAPYYLQDTSLPWSKNVKAFSPCINFALFEVDGKKISLKVISSTGEVLDRCDDLSRELKKK